MEASPFVHGVDGSVSVVLLDFGGVLKVEQGSLGCDIEAALGIGGPAVVTSVPVVVGVAVRHMLEAVVTLSVEHVAGLEGHGHLTCFHVLDSKTEEKVYWHDALNSSKLEKRVSVSYKDSIHGDSHVLLGHVAVDDKSLEILQKGHSVPRLVGKVMVVTGESMVAYHTLQKFFHSRHFYYPIINYKLRQSL